ncbi:MAG: glycoside hydrolase family 2 [Clostridia bacterium]|nr:glycoside hydrolase family 2 [Clostridia bacterium]
MVRDSWQCLNGLWEYAFLDKKEVPVQAEGEILVPFSPETNLSGVGKQLLPGQFLWYKKQIRLSDEIKSIYQNGGRLLLHFGAVDQSCEVFVNNKFAGSHFGGYLPFSLDITGLLGGTGSAGDAADSEETDRVADCQNEVGAGRVAACSKEDTFEITLFAEDASDTSFHSVGKQTLKPGGMYYQATSGVWQTVWLEAVPGAYIRDITWETDYDKKTVKPIVEIVTDKEKSLPDYTLRVTFLKGEYENAEWQADTEKTLCLPEFISWCPENPYLYEVRVELLTKAVVCDTVQSYFAMRKCSIGTDDAGIRRIFLNNRPYMQVGLLDQGYWPESMYTAPSDEALRYDIEKMKDLGFNMLRKHIKVEPERWYYYCDRMGMLVWQDMINGGRKNKGWYVTYLATVFQILGIRASDKHKYLLSRQDKAGREAYVSELKELMALMKKHPSVVCIVPFNEGWGQFETKKMAELVKSECPDIIVDAASGWYDQGCGDLKSIHWYFLKFKYKREKERALALTEFGGYVQRIEGHTLHDKEYGYKIFKSKEELEKAYETLMAEAILPAVEDGVSATVYTQVSDVEEEINGLLTYDRKVLKIDAGLLRKWNEKLMEAVAEKAEK